MKRWLLLTVVLLLVAAPAFAQGVCPGVTQTLCRVYAHETLSVTTVVPFTSSVYAPAGKSPQQAVATLEGAQLRAWSDGTTPTTGVGQLINTNVFYVCGQINIQNFKMVSTSGTGTVSIQYCSQ